ncbi:hypothetical protein TEA_029613 [Camellia sinensis var. sinensis]|uniref:Uncharacterized protein n=1 Tax=Camellia sinensis var. sinensis TaxID=542762 RepID=A0A4S4DP91_CAMSN|nr:hypothetical protein TEA_029613 [Camellia sinensis var. sinensis]
MKNVAKCDTWRELRNTVNHRVFERKLRPKPEETLVEARNDTDMQIVRLTWAEEGKGSMGTALAHGLVDPKSRGKPDRECVQRELRKGIGLKFLNRDVAADGNVRESRDVSGGLGKSYHFCLTACPPWKRLSRRQGKSAKWIRNFGKRIGSEGWARGSQSRTRQLSADYSSCSRGESGSPRAGRWMDRERLLAGPSPGSEQSTQN